MPHPSTQHVADDVRQNPHPLPGTSDYSITIGGTAVLTLTVADGEDIEEVERFLLDYFAARTSASAATHAHPHSRGGLSQRHSRHSRS